MTTTPNSDAQPVQPTQFDHEKGDPLLTILVQSFNKSGSGVMSITLSVAGAIVTGYMISRVEYLGLVAGALDAVSKDSSVAGFFKDLASREGEVDNDSQPLYINLKNAFYVTGSSPSPGVNSGGVLWRGRLSEVAGWSLGKIDFS